MTSIVPQSCLAVPTLIVAILGAVQGGSCDSPLLIYLIVALLLAMINIAFAVFLMMSIKLYGVSEVISARLVQCCAVCFCDPVLCVLFF